MGFKMTEVFLQLNPTNLKFISAIDSHLRNVRQACYWSFGKYTDINLRTEAEEWPYAETELTRQARRGVPWERRLKSDAVRWDGIDTSSV